MHGKTGDDIFHNTGGKREGVICVIDWHIYKDKEAKMNRW